MSPDGLALCILWKKRKVDGVACCVAWFGVGWLWSGRWGAGVSHWRAGASQEISGPGVLISLENCLGSILKIFTNKIVLCKKDFFFSIHYHYDKYSARYTFNSIQEYRRKKIS